MKIGAHQLRNGSVIRLVVFRRHGVTHGLPLAESGEPVPHPRDSWFWPDQAFRDMLSSQAMINTAAIDSRMS